jgi:hypothetical protein
METDNAEVNSNGTVSQESQEYKLAFICGKALSQAESLALQSGLSLKLVTKRLGEFFHRS